MESGTEFQSTATIDLSDGDFPSVKSEEVVEVLDNQYKDIDDSEDELNGIRLGSEDSDIMVISKDQFMQDTKMADSDPVTGVFASIPYTPDISRRTFSSSISRMGAFFSSQSKTKSPADFNAVDQKEMDEYKTTPIFTSEVGNYLDHKLLQNGQLSEPFTQFGLLGVRKATLDMPAENEELADGEAEAAKNLVVANMDTPWSAFICGSQGAGKSHTLSCLLENAIMGGSDVGHLPNPLAAMVFHYDSYTSTTCSQICEAAYLCSSGVPVTILVSPSNIWALQTLYTNLPGLAPGSPRPKILPLYLSANVLDISTMLKLMAIDPKAESPPLYMETVMSILREMAMEGKGAGAFSYAEFRARLDEVQWVKGQTSPLSLRLQLLDSFLEPSQFTRSTRPAPAKENIWTFEPGTLTIVDLSDPFINSSDACALFGICLSLFLEDRAKCGRVVALDEAHKFLLQTGAARALTSDLTSVIRQQRHTGTRVIIATQEPTLSPEIIDLANATFVHRFLSPAWYEVLKKHLAGANRHDLLHNQASLFQTIVGLETGEALLFCPTALVGVDKQFDGSHKVQKLGDSYIRIRMRGRITADGGKSILASETTNMPTLDDVQNIPMHFVAKPTNTKSPGKGKSKAGPVFGLVSAPAANTRSASALPKENRPVATSHESPGPSKPTNRQQPTTSTKEPSKEQLNKAKKSIRSRMRKYFVDLGWHSKHQIVWDRIVAEVEQDVGLQTGTLRTRAEVMARLKQAACAEQDTCNEEHLFNTITSA